MASLPNDCAHSLPLDLLFAWAQARCARSASEQQAWVLVHRVRGKGGRSKNCEGADV